jgi:Ca-activated chloride channel family protein
MSHAAAVLATPPSNPSAGGRLVAVDGRALPLLGTRLTATAAGGLCRVLLEQRFRNPHAEPLRVTYLFPLPHQGAVSGFAFRLGAARVVGEVDRLAAARERFERALVEGKTAGLLEQVRGSVFTQELGNVPPGAEVVAEITVDQRLAWLPEGAWEWRFPTALAPRYQGAAGRVPDAARLAVDLVEGDLPPRLSLSLEVKDGLTEGGALTSPTHALAAGASQGGRRAALAAEGGVPLDRDLAIRWPVAAPQVGLSLQAARAPDGSRLAGRSFGLATLVPPRPGSLRAVPRDLIVLLDTSGSMSGEPLDQARAVVSALVGSLGDEDQLELIEFSDAPRRWKAGPVAATDKARREALAWLAGLEAGSSTEMAHALLEALHPLRGDAQRQVVLVTDGQIGFEQEILRTVIERLPAGSRLHAVAVGDAVNRSLTGPAARAGRGVEVVVGLEEPAEAAAARLLARTVSPVVTEVVVDGDALVGAASARVPDLFAGAPVLLPLELAPGGGTLTVRGVTADGPFTRTLEVPAAAPSVGPTPLGALFAREAVEELELQASLGREAKRLDAAIEALGLAFQISTRRTSWVAVSEEATVDPRQPTRREVMPQQLPHGQSVAGLGLRAAGAPMSTVAACMPLQQLRQLVQSDSFDSEDVVELGAIHQPAFPDFDQPGREAKKEASRFGRRRQDAGPPPPPPVPSSTGGRPPPPAGRAAKASPAPRRLAARLVQRADDLLIVEFEVLGAALDWDPSSFLRLDGAPRTACAVDAAASTAAGLVAVGQTVRLVLRLAPSALPQLLRRRMPARPAGLRFADGLCLELPRPEGKVRR